jgi:hypothetical protein
MKKLEEDIFLNDALIPDRFAIYAFVTTSEMIDTFIRDAFVNDALIPDILPMYAFDAFIFEQLLVADTLIPL